MTVNDVWFILAWPIGELLSRFVYIPIQGRIYGHVGAHRA